MSDFQAIADRVEIEALRGEFTDAVMMRDYDRVASLFTPDGALRMPNIPVELEGREEIRAWASGCRLWWTTWCRPPTRARSSLTATPRPVVPTYKSSGGPATAARS
jgi:ketosteroid isomerase-like protein